MKDFQFLCSFSLNKNLMGDETDIFVIVFLLVSLLAAFSDSFLVCDVLGTIARFFPALKVNLSPIVILKNEGFFIKWSCDSCHLHQ